MYINEWHHGCRVTVSDWIGKDEDGQTPIRIGVEYFKPGASINRPEWERVIYCPRREETKIKNYLDSIVCAICSGAILLPSAQEATKRPFYALQRSEGINNTTRTKNAPQRATESRRDCDDLDDLDDAFGSARGWEVVAIATTAPYGSDGGAHA